MLWALRRAGRLGGIALDHRAEPGVDPLQYVGVELDPDRLDVVAHLLGAGGADDGAGDVRVLQDPGDRELRHGEAQVGGDRLELLYAGGDVVVHEAGDHVGAAGRVGRPGACRRGLAGQVLAGQYALRDGRPDDLADALTLAERHDLRLDD